MFYQDFYPFVLRNALQFNKYFDPVRITPSILQFTLAPDQQAELERLLNDATQSAEQRSQQLLALHKRHMDTVRVYGTSQALLYIP